MNNINKILSTNISNLLESMQRQPAWLAEKSGLAKSQIGRILKTETSVTLDTLSKIAAALECSPNQLLIPTSTKKTASSSFAVSETILTEIQELRAMLEDKRNSESTELNELRKIKQALDEKYGRDGIYWLLQVKDVITPQTILAAAGKPDDSEQTEEWSPLPETQAEVRKKAVKTR